MDVQSTQSLTETYSSVSKTSILLNTKYRFPIKTIFKNYFTGKIEEHYLKVKVINFNDVFLFVFTLISRGYHIIFKLNINC